MILYLGVSKRTHSPSKYAEYNLKSKGFFDMKNKILALLALVMVFAVICTMSVAVFADETSTADDTSADTATDNTDDTADGATDDTASGDSSETTGETSDDETKEEEKEPTWWDNYNQIIGWIVAGVIFVAIVLVSIWWIRSGFKPSKK